MKISASKIFRIWAAYRIVIFSIAAFLQYIDFGHAMWLFLGALPHSFLFASNLPIIKNFHDFLFSKLPFPLTALTFMLLTLSLDYVVFKLIHFITRHIKPTTNENV